METIIEFQDAREEFLRIGNYFVDDREKSRSRDESLLNGLERLRRCNNEEAQFISGLFKNFETTLSNNETTAVQEARRVFLNQIDQPTLSMKNNKRVLCYAGFLTPEVTWSMVERSAQDPDGHGLAQSFMNRFGSTYHRIVEWADKAILQGERIGYLVLGSQLSLPDDLNAISPNNDVHLRAKEMFKCSAYLGCSSAMVSYSNYFAPTSEEKWLWLCRAAQKGLYGPLCRTIYNATDEYIRNTNYCSVIFMMGSVLQMFNFDYNYYSKTNMHFPKYFNYAMELYDYWCDNARDATICWMLVAKRLRLYKDVALLIAKQVWEGRGKDYFKLSDNRKFWTVLYPS